MGRELILDTSVLIELERSQLLLDDIVQPDHDIAIASLSVTYLRVGVLLAGRRFRRAQKELLRQTIESYEIAEYTDTVSRRHADLIAWTRRAGVTRNPNDLIVAATAAATGRELLSLDRAAAFADLPGVVATDLGGP